MIQPRNDRVLVERIPEPAKRGVIHTPECAEQQSVWTRIVAVGPGKRHEGYWHLVSVPVCTPHPTELIVVSWEDVWEWEDGWLEPTVVKPGQIAIIGPYTDFEEGQQVLIQEADIRCIVENAG